MILLTPYGVYSLSPQDVSPHFPLYMGLTSAAIIAWVLSVFPIIDVAAMLTFAYILCGVADVEVIFGPWATVLPWLSFAAVIIGEGMEKTGLAKWLALRCLKLTGGSFSGLVAELFFAGLVLVVILPSILARVVIFYAIAVGIIQALQLEVKSRMSSTIVIVAFFAVTAPQFMSLRSSESFIWAFRMMLKGTDRTVNFRDYAYQAIFINLIYYALSMAMAYIVEEHRTLVSGAHFSTFTEQSCREIGPIQPREVKLLVLVFGIILGFMLEPSTHIDPVYVCCVLALLSYLPGINVFDRESLSNLNIVFLVFITGCMAIGFVGGSVGANKWAVASIVPLLQGWGEIMSIVCIYAAGVVIGFLLTPLAAMAAFTSVFGELGTAMNVNPPPLFYAFNFGLDQYIFPYEAVYSLYIFITERVLLRHTVTASAIRMLIVGISVAVLAVPYWNGIGLM